MPNSPSSSDSSGGGAPLHSPQARKQQESPTSLSKASALDNDDDANTSSPATAEEEQALVRASSGFARHSAPPSDMQKGYGDSSGNNGSNGPNRLPLPGRPQTAFRPGGGGGPFESAQGANMGHAQPNGPPMSAIMYQQLTSLHNRLMASHQHIRLTPGVTPQAAEHIISMMVSLSQELNMVAHSLINDHRRNQFQNGELRIKLDRAHKELLARHAQVKDLQDKYKQLVHEKDSHQREFDELTRRASTAETNLHRITGHQANLVSDFNAADEEKLERIKALEAQIDELKREKSMQIPKAVVNRWMALSPEPYSAGSQRSFLSDDDDSRTVVMGQPRRGSGLNPAAPIFGVRSASQAAGKRPSSAFNGAMAGTSRSTNKGFADNGLIQPDLVPLAMQPNYNQHLALPGASSRSDHRGKDGGLSGKMMNLSLGGNRGNFQSGGPSTAVPGRGNGDGNGYQSDVVLGGTAATEYEQSSLLPPTMRKYRPGIISGGNTSNTSATDPFEGMRGPRSKEDWDEEDLTNGFKRLFEMAEGIVATQHCTPPFNELDSVLPISHPETWEHVIALGYPNQTQSSSHMNHLLSQEDLRHFVIKRVYIDYIFTRLIHPEIFMGFTEELDGHLRALQECLRSRESGQKTQAALEAAPTRPANETRQQIIEDHSKLIRAILNHPAGREFRKAVVNRHSSMLLEILRPMRNVSMDDETAHKTIRVAVNAAFTISAKVWTGGLTINWFFPETAAKFNFAQMSPLNQLHVSPEQMQYTQYRVMLVITPALTLRDEREADTVRTCELMKANVLVMK